ncbi:MAG: hypothetical protein JNK24_08160 [Alphaproteobacteria bacterium]|nr:hypothetical protein [Alphaproteobacteria bacterium]
MRSKEIFNAAVDPLRIMTTFSLIGDAFYTASGAAHDNPIRAIAALVGTMGGLIGLKGQGKTVAGIETGKIVMNVHRLCGLAYMLSGSNVFGFEASQRLTEILTGSCVVLATTANLRHSPKLGGVFFMASTATTAAQFVETALRTGESTDWYMLGAFASFLVANISSFYVKRNEPHMAPALQT